MHTWCLFLNLREWQDDQMYKIKPSYYHYLDILFHIQGEFFIGILGVALNMWIESNAEHTIVFNSDFEVTFILLEYYDITTFFKKELGTSWHSLSDEISHALSVAEYDLKMSPVSNKQNNCICMHSRELLCWLIK